ncbi:MAG: X2-like carbohydrate binding domain-containing protein [Clostridia bacterium]|nr:X2-like carbohydrate binding domain-containing protein [Clostridia bacterium]
MFALIISGLTFSMSNVQTEVADAASATSVKILGFSITTRSDLSQLITGVDGEFSGYTTFSNGVLTLEDVSIQYVSSETAVIEATNGDLRIECIGENDLTNSWTGSSVINLGNGTLTLSGDGSLNINASATPIYVNGGDVIFDCAEVTLSNEFSSVWLNGANFVRFRTGTLTRIFGGERAISNLNGDGFYNEEFAIGCGAKAGFNENDVFDTNEYTGQKYLFVYTNAVLTCENSTFDKYAPAKIAVSIELNGNTFYGINGLTEGANYTISGNIITLETNNFAGRSVGSRVLLFTFDPGNDVAFEVAIIDTTPTTSVSLSINSATYNADYATVIETVVSQPTKFVSVSGLTSNDYYYEKGSGRFIFIDTYLEGLSNNEYTYVFSFSGGAMSRTFKLTVVNSIVGDVVNPPTGLNSYITPYSGIFDKYTAKSEYAPLIVNITFNGNSLISIKNGLDTISPKNYSRIDTKVTISITYLNNLAVADYTLTFEFSDGDPQVLSLVVKNTDPLPNNQTPYYNDPLVRMDIPGLGEGNTADPDSPSDDSGSVVTPDIIVGDGGTAAFVVVGCFAGVSALSCVVWIILRKKRIV